MTVLDIILCTPEPVKNLPRTVKPGRGGHRWRSESTAHDSCSSPPTNGGKQVSRVRMLVHLFYGSDLPERPSPTSMRLVYIQGRCSVDQTWTEREVCS
jgi:hypothetical protein